MLTFAHSHFLADKVGYRTDFTYVTDSGGRGNGSSDSTQELKLHCKRMNDLVFKKKKYFRNKRTFFVVQRATIFGKAPSHVTRSSTPMQLLLPLFEATFNEIWTFLSKNVRIFAKILSRNFSTPRVHQLVKCRIVCARDVSKQDWGTLNMQVTITEHAGYNNRTITRNFDSVWW